MDHSRKTDYQRPGKILDIKKKFFHCEGGEIAQRNCGCPIPADVQGWAEWI